MHIPPPPPPPPNSFLKQKSRLFSPCYELIEMVWYPDFSKIIGFCFTPDEDEEAEKRVIHVEQARSFFVELDLLEEGKGLPKLVDYINSRQF